MFTWKYNFDNFPWSSIEPFNLKLVFILKLLHYYHDKNKINIVKIKVAAAAPFREIGTFGNSELSEDRNFREIEIFDFSSGLFSMPVTFEH